MTKNTTAFKTTNRWSCPSSGWPSKVCKRKSSPQSLMWWVYTNHLSDLYALMKMCRNWNDHVPPVVIWHPHVGAAHQRRHPVSRCWPLRHYALLVEGTSTSTATVLPRYSVRIIRVFVPFLSFNKYAVCWYPWVFLFVFFTFFYSLINDKPSFCCSVAINVFLPQLLHHAVMLGPRARLQTQF